MSVKHLVAGTVTGLLLGAAVTMSLPESTHDAPRSSKWPSVRLQHLSKEPACVVCGETTKVEVHHVKPFHLYPESELDLNNLVTLCANPSCKSHLTLGHLGNYDLSNPEIKQIAETIKGLRVQARSKQ